MMKIVRFSQNGHAARLGCYVYRDEITDLAASCVAFLTARGQWPRHGWWLESVLESLGS